MSKSNKLRVVCFADSHVNDAAYGRIDPASGLNARTVQSLGLMRQVVDYAVEHEADALVFAGDAFKNHLPPPTVINEVVKVFVDAARAGVTTLVLDGNHDVSAQATSVSGLGLMSTLGVPNLIHSRFHRDVTVRAKDGTPYAFKFLPTHHSFEEVIECLNAVDPTLPTVVVGHLTVAKAALNDWTVVKEGELVEASDFARKGVVAAVLGHLHKHQVLSTEPLVFYCGSTNRVSFTEERQPKGFVDLTLDGFNPPKMVHVPLEGALKFKTIRVTTEDTEATERVLEAVSAADVKGAVVRVVLTAPKGAVVDERAVAEAVDARGAEWFTKVAYAEAEEATVELTEEAVDDVPTAVAEYFAGEADEARCVEFALGVVRDVNEKEGEWSGLS